MATATEGTVLEAQPRVAGTKNDARRVRVGGKVPAVLYGAGKEALSVSLDPRQVSRILHSQTGYNTIFDLALDGGERTKAMIVDWQYEPIKGALLHIDLKRIAMDKTLTVNVPIVLKGEVVATPEAVAAEAGATPAEPEVIKKGKQEAGEEGAEPAAEKAEKPEKKEKKWISPQSHGDTEKAW